MSQKGNLITVTGVMWDPQGVSDRIRMLLLWIYWCFKMPVSWRQLDGFEMGVVVTTPVNYFEDAVGRPAIQFPDGMIAIYHNGVNVNTKPGGNVPSVVFINATPYARSIIPLLVAQLGMGTVQWLGSNSLRVIIDDDDLVLALKTPLCQHPVPFLPWEKNM